MEKTPVKNPGSRGGKFYMHEGRVVYGSPGKLPQPPDFLQSADSFNMDAWRIAAAVAVKANKVGDYGFMIAAYRKIQEKLPNLSIDKAADAGTPVVPKSIWSRIKSMLGLGNSSEAPRVDEVQSRDHMVEAETPVQEEALKPALYKDLIASSLVDLKINVTDSLVEYVHNNLEESSDEDVNTEEAFLSSVRDLAKEFYQSFDTDRNPKKGSWFYNRVNPKAGAAQIVDSPETEYSTIALAGSHRLVDVPNKFLVPVKFKREED